MAKVGITSLALIFVVLTICRLVPQVSALDGAVGGKQEIENVKGNKEIQNLGKFCVDKYNKGLNDNGQKLKFSEVVKAEKQVVAGLKYYLTIAVKAGSASKTFDAEVMVKPRARDTEMIAFGPTNLATLT